MIITCCFYEGNFLPLILTSSEHCDGVLTSKLCPTLSSASRLEHFGKRMSQISFNFRGDLRSREWRSSHSVAGGQDITCQQHSFASCNQLFNFLNWEIMGTYYVSFF